MTKVIVFIGFNAISEEFIEKQLFFVFVFSSIKSHHFILKIDVFLENKTF